jgi:outer membrane receptor for ferrienterochelin and colicin
VTTYFRTAAADARLAIPIVEGLTLTPQITYRWEQPWSSRTPDLPDFYYDVTNQRLTTRLVALWDTLTGPSFVFGAEAYWQRGVVNQFDLGLQSFGDKSSISFSDVAAFAEAGVDTDWANVLAGARFEHQSGFGDAFVPRLALTKLFAPFHVKLLASGAYRAPSTENVNLAAGQIKPERTWVVEGEVGWQLNEVAYLSANVFDVTLLDPIVFAFNGAETYSNLDRTGSRGAEAEVVLGRGPAVLSASYSFYTAQGKNQVPAYAVAGSKALLVGFAGHKVVASGRLRPTRSLLLVPTVVFLSPRSAYDGTEAPGAPAAGRIGARTTLDLFAAWQDLGTEGVELGVGVQDLFDQGVPLVQPYPGGHNPLPYGGREVWFRLRWQSR